MSGAILQSESEEKLERVLDFAKKQGVAFRKFASGKAHLTDADKSIILAGGDGQSISQPRLWQKQTREDRI